MEYVKRLCTRHARVALCYFLIAAVFGFILRIFPLAPVPANYRFLLHTHSHIALLGWVYLGLTTLIFSCFIDWNTRKKYNRIFWFTQLSLLGMLISFPLQGYGLFSIAFSTLFLFASYWFTLFFLTNARKELRGSPSVICIRAALWYLVISSLGPWALGIIMNTLGAQSDWYRMAIYFFLHFQYNGWMILALTGLALYSLEKQGVAVQAGKFRSVFLCLNAGIILSFLLSALWLQPHWMVYILAGLGALLQVIGFVFLFRSYHSYLKVASFTALQKFVGTTTLVLLSFKLALQVLTSFPYFATIAVKYPDLIIGYLHLTFLGVVSLGLFFLLDYFKILLLSKRYFVLYFTGFLWTEILIFYRGVASWGGWGMVEAYFAALALGSLIIIAGLAGMLSSAQKSGKPNQPVTGRNGI